MPSLSVIVPALNAQASLGATLASIQAQTFTDWECIVVDDGSSDATSRIAADFAASDPRFHVIRQSNRGVSAARNAGISRASADWLHFLDSDDRIDPPHLALLMAAADRHERADVIYCDWRLVSPDGTEGPRRRVDITFDPVSVFAGGCAVIIHAAILRRAAVLEAGGFDPGLRLCEDWDLWQRLARLGAVMRRTPDALASYFVRPGSVSGDMKGFLGCALDVIRRGHCDDPRLAGRALTAPLWPMDQLRTTTCFAFWLAGRAIGAGQDAAELISGVGLFPGFDSETAANLVLEGIQQGAALAAPDWPMVWPRFRPAVRHFLDHVSGRVGQAGFARIVLRHAERRMLAAVSDDTRIGASVLRHVELGRTPRGVWMPPGTDRLIGVVTGSGRTLGRFELAATWHVGPSRVAELMTEFAAEGGAEAAPAPPDHRDRAYWTAIAGTRSARDDLSSYRTLLVPQTLDAIAGRPRRALELGCGDSPLAAALAERSDHLVVADIAMRGPGSEGRTGNTERRGLDWLHDELPDGMDLILCSEILYHLGEADDLALLADRIGAALAPGGRLILAHSWLAGDLGRKSGFRWPYRYGAGSIGTVFARSRALDLIEDRVSDFHRVMVFGRRDVRQAPAAPRIVPLPPPGPLPESAAAAFVWEGPTPAQYRRPAEGIPILMYHRIAGDASGPLARYATRPSDFAAQMGWLKRNGFNTVTAEDFADALWDGHDLPERPVVVSFDDGYRDNLVNAVPVLKSMGMTATIFIPTDHVGNAAVWDAGYGMPAPLMGWAELAQVRAAGIGLSSHGGSHRPMAALPAAALRGEASRSRRRLHKQLGVTTRTLAYPYGIHDEAVQRTLVDEGYRMGFTTESRCYRRGDRIMAVPRIEVMGGMTLDAFAAAIGTTGDAG